MSIFVFIPILSMAPLISLRENSCIDDLLKAIWREVNLHLAGSRIKFSQLSVHSLVSDSVTYDKHANLDLNLDYLQVKPVSLEPRGTLSQRIADSKHDNGSVGTSIQDKVLPHWCDLEKVYVYLYVDQGPGEPGSGKYSGGCNDQLFHHQ